MEGSNVQGLGNKSTQLYDAFIGHSRQRYDYWLAAAKMGRLVLAYPVSTLYSRLHVQLVVQQVVQPVGWSKRAQPIQDAFSDNNSQISCTILRETLIVDVSW